MEIKQTAKALSDIEVKALKALREHGEQPLGDISKNAGIPEDSVRRALSWLLEKKLVETSGEQELVLLTGKGRHAREKGLPERILAETLKTLGKKAGIQEARQKSGLSQGEFNAALGYAKRMNWIVFSQGEIELTGIEETELPGEKILKSLADAGVPASGFQEEEKAALERMAARSLVEIKKYKMGSAARAVITSPGLKALEIASKTKARAYNISGEVPRLVIGKKQPYVRFLEQIRERLARMGFKEMKTPYIVQEFYNFDVLFQPQNHPARDWANTYQLKKPKLGKLPGKKYVKAVKDAHEFGAKTGSTGWKYKWSEEIAKKLMPAAHGTAHSARQLVEGVEVPGKYFSIARCYRPDTVDRTHLIEFNQLEGIIVGNFSFKHLLGMLKQFAEEIAHAKDVKFFPDYYPFTSPSVQLSALHPEMGWMEFGGAGMFRPEMLEPLGIKEQVLAWGLGIDRLAMFKLGISDIRELFSQRLDWLRNEKMVVLE